MTQAIILPTLRSLCRGISHLTIGHSIRIPICILTVQRPANACHRCSLPPTLLPPQEDSNVYQVALFYEAQLWPQSLSCPSAPGRLCESPGIGMWDDSYLPALADAVEGNKTYVRNQNARKIAISDYLQIRTYKVLEVRRRFLSIREDFQVEWYLR